MRVSKIIYAAAAVALALGGQAAQAEYKQGDKVTVLQGFKPGGGSDVLAQLTQPHLQKELGVTFVNQYVPGATGAIAWTQLAHQSKSDGSVISITNTPMLMTNYIMNEDIRYTIDDLEPLVNVVTDPGVIVVGKDSPFKTAQEFLDHAKANPGRIRVGNSGVGGDDFFTTLMLQRASDMKFTMVPFQGDGPSWQAAMAGKIDASFNNLGTVYSQVESGNLRMLAIFTEERHPKLPDVPTLKELGYDVVAGSSRGYSGPKGMPEDKKQQFIAAMQKVAADPKFKKDAEAQALDIDIITGDEYRTFMKEQETEFKEIWNEVKGTIGNGQ